jgi:hypothetical protein
MLIPVAQDVPHRPRGEWPAAMVWDRNTAVQRPIRVEAAKDELMRPTRTLLPSTTTQRPHHSFPCDLRHLRHRQSFGGAPRPATGIADDIINGIKPCLSIGDSRSHAREHETCTGPIVMHDESSGALGEIDVLDHLVIAGGRLGSLKAQRLGFR